MFATKEDITSLRGELKEDIANLRTAIAESKAETIKWMFIFWIGNIGVLSGIMFAFFNFFIKR